MCILHWIAFAQEKKYNKDKNKCKEGRVIANLKQSAYINKLEETQTKLG